MLEFFKKPEFEILTDPELHMSLEVRTSELVESIRKNHIKTVIFLGDGGVPLIPMFVGAWKKHYPKDPLPKITILNIGREKYPPLRRYVYQYEEDMRMSDSQLLKWLTAESLPQIYDEAHVAQLRRVIESIKSDKIMVVDDIIGQGSTRKMADALLNATLPESQIEHFYYFYDRKHQNSQDQALNTNLPRLMSAESPWSNRYPKAQSFEEIEGDQSDFLFSQRPESHRRILRQAIEEAKQIFETRHSNDKSVNQLIEAYFKRRK